MAIAGMWGNQDRIKWRVIEKVSISNAKYLQVKNHGYSIS